MGIGQNTKKAGRISRGYRALARAFSGIIGIGGSSETWKIRRTLLILSGFCFLLGQAFQYWRADLFAADATGGLALALTSLAATSQLLEALSITLFAAFVIACVYERHVVKLIRRDLLQSIEDYALGKDKLLHSGVIDMREGIPWPELVAEEREAAEEFLLIQTWSPQLPNLLDSILPHVNEGMRAKIFLLNPYSEFARARSVALGLDSSYVRTQVQLNCMEIQAFYNKLVEQSEESDSDYSGVEIVYVDELPSHCVYRVGPSAWIGSFMKGKRADSGPVMRVLCKPNTAMWSAVLHLIEALTSSPRSVKLTLSDHDDIARLNKKLSASATRNANDVETLLNGIQNSA